MSRKNAAAELAIEYADNKLSARFQAILDEIGNMGQRAVARRYNVNQGILSRMVNDGREPVDAEIRRRLGFPVLVSVEPCAVCGRVHRRSHPTPRKRARRRVSCYPLVDVGVWYER